MAHDGNVQRLLVIVATIDLDPKSKGCSQIVLRNCE